AEEVSPVLVKVNLPGSGPCSEASASVATTLTVGSCDDGWSLSAMVIAALLGDPTSYAASAVNVSTTVSSPSASVSSIGVTVTVAEAEPAGMVTEVPGC